MQLAPNVVVANRYRVRRCVGSGGMAEVWEAEHHSIGVRVALKQLLPRAAETPEIVARFRREAALLARVRSDHVARLLDFVDEQPYGPVLVMEFVEGATLARVVRSRQLEIEDAIDIGIDVARAVRELHACGIVHRDLKPANVLLERMPNRRRRALLVDLGMARAYTPAKRAEPGSELTGSDVALGTMEYMAPEQITNSREAGFGADVYAIGAMLYRAVTGRHVFDDLRGTELARAKLLGEAPPLELSRQDDLARRFVALVTSMLRRDPAKRPATAGAVLAELNALRTLARTRPHTAISITDARTRLFSRTRANAARAASEERRLSSRRPKSQVGTSRVERLRVSACTALAPTELVDHRHRFCVAGVSALALALLTGGAAAGAVFAMRPSTATCATPAGFLPAAYVAPTAPPTTSATSPTDANDGDDSFEIVPTPPQARAPRKALSGHERTDPAGTNASKPNTTQAPRARDAACRAGANGSACPGAVTMSTDVPGHL